MPLTSGARLGAYEIVSSLGAGGMGEVYRARGGKLGRDVAIKVLPDALVTDPVSRANLMVDLGVKVSPDGEWFFGNQESGRPVIVPVMGGAPRSFPTLNENDSLLAWAPDGGSLIVARIAGDRSAATIARMSVATGELEMLKQVRISDTSGTRNVTFVATPDGQTVVMNVSRYLNDLYLVEGLR
jgi:serine/threonine protein kinase